MVRTVATSKLNWIKFLLPVVLLFSFYLSYKNTFQQYTYLPEDLSDLVHKYIVPADGFPLAKNSNKGRCLSLDFDGEMDRLLSTHRQVFVAMPAKASGTTMKEFTAICTQMDVHDNVLNPTYKKGEPFDPMEELLGLYLEPPSLITSHLYNEKTLHTLIKHATKQSLIIYLHREETSRVISAIAEVAESQMCSIGSQKGAEREKELKSMIESRKNIPCELGEKSLVSQIRSQKSEIGLGATAFLTCETYDAIQNNAPNMVFLHYKEVNRLQKLIAKHHCPKQLEAEPVATNTKSQKRRIDLKLQQDNSIVSLQEWLDAKRNILELVLEMKKDMSCQAKTRGIEDALLACPNGALEVSPLAE